MLLQQTIARPPPATAPASFAKAERFPTPPRDNDANTDNGLPVHSFRSLCSPFSASLPRFQATTALNEKYVLTLHTRPTPIQSRAFELLAINPDRTQ